MDVADATNGAPPRRALTTRDRAVLRQASALVDRFRWADTAGLDFDSTDTKATGWNRDYYWTLGYKRTLRYSDYRAEYERGGIAERIVEAFPRATWAGGADLVEDPDPGVETEWEREVRELFARTDFWAKMLRADILAGIGEYGGLMIGAGGPGDDPKLELPQLKGPEAVLYFRPLSEGIAPIDRVVGDRPDEASDPRFGLPTGYRVKFGKAASSITVHWSRVIHLAEGTLEDEVYGRPRLRPVWNYLKDLLKVVGGGAEASYRRAAPRWHFDMDHAVEMPADEESALEDEIDEFVHDLGSTLHTFGTKVTPISANPYSFAPNQKALVELIAGTAGLPVRILLGSERGEQASTQDRFNFQDRTDERRRDVATPAIRATTERLIDHGALSKPAEWEAVWPDRDTLSEAEKAVVVAQMATANKAQVEATGEPLMTSDEIRDTILGRGPLSDVWEAAQAVGPVVARKSTRASLIAAKLRLARSHGIPRRGRSQVFVSAFDLTDSPADEPEWQAIHRAADSRRDAFAAAVVGVWRGAAEAIAEDDLAAALERSWPEAEEIVLSAMDQAEEEMRAAVEAQLLATLTAGAEAALRSARARGSWFRGAAVQMSFDATNPRSLEWAAEQAGLLVTEITPETIATLQALIARGFAEGIPPRALAQEIRAAVGLRIDQEDAVLNLLTEIRGAEPGALIERFPPRPGLRSQAGFRVRVPESGASAEWTDRQLTKYRSMQRNLRARTIARTETMHAANEGQRELWRQAMDAGQIERDQKRVWISTPDDRVRPEHAERHGTVVGVDEPWPWGTEPGEEINCRCSQGIATPEDLAAAGITATRRAPIAGVRLPV